MNNKGFSVLIKSVKVESNNLPKNKKKGEGKTEIIFCEDYT